MDWNMDRNVLGCMMPECMLSLHRSMPCAHTDLYVIVNIDTIAGELCPSYSIYAVKRFTSYPRPFKFLLASLLAYYIYWYGASPDINMYACSPLRL